MSTEVKILLIAVRFVQDQRSDLIQDSTIDKLPFDFMGVARCKGPDIFSDWTYVQNGMAFGELRSAGFRTTQGCNVVEPMTC